MCIEAYPEPEGEQKHYCHRHHLAEELIEAEYFRKREDIVSDEVNLTDFA
jgi:ParB family chromosome partitioning protein